MSEVKLLITETGLGPNGNHYNLIPVDPSYPDELEGFAGSRVVQVTAEQATEIIQNQRIGIRTQKQLAVMYRDGKWIGYAEAKEQRTR